MRVRHTLLVIVLSLVACSPAEDSNQYVSTLNSAQVPRSVTIASDALKDDANYIEEAEVIFAKDFTETLTQEIYANDILTIHYDLQRMTECQREGRHDLQYVTGYYQVDDQPVDIFEYIPNYSTAHRLQSTKIRVPQGKQLAIWFYSVDSNGCETWDTNYGDNYIVSISEEVETGPEGLPFVSFKANGEVTQSQTIKSGSPLIIRHDLQYLGQCESV